MMSLESWGSRVASIFSSSGRLALSVAGAGLLMAVSMCLLPGNAYAQAGLQSFQKLGCYYNKQDNNRIWLAAVAADKKFTNPNFYDDDAFMAVLGAGDNRFNIPGKDILVNVLGNFNYKGAEKFNFMRYSLVVDYSSSIPAHIRTDVLNFLTAFLGDLPLAVEGQLIRFTDGVEKFPFTKNKEDIVAQMRQPINYGMTALHDAMMEAASSLIQQKDVPLRMIVLITDGLDTSSKQFQDKATFISSFTNLVKNERIMVLAIGVTSAPDAEILKSITSVSDGVIGLYLPIEDFGRLNMALTHIKSMVQNTVLFRLPKLGPDKGKFDIMLALRSKTGSLTTLQAFDCAF